jgi:hypothetical protein
MRCSVAPAMSLQTMRSRVHVKIFTPNQPISAQATAAQAEGIANAVANSYAACVRPTKRRRDGAGAGAGAARRTFAIILRCT